MTSSACSWQSSIEVTGSMLVIVLTARERYRAVTVIYLRCRPSAGRRGDLCGPQTKPATSRTTAFSPTSQQQCNTHGKNISINPEIDLDAVFFFGVVKRLPALSPRCCPLLDSITIATFACFCCYSCGFDCLDSSLILFYFIILYFINWFVFLLLDFTWIPEFVCFLW